MAAQTLRTPRQPHVPSALSHSGREHVPSAASQAFGGVLGKNLTKEQLTHLVRPLPTRRIRLAPPW